MVGGLSTVQQTEIQQIVLQTSVDLDGTEEQSVAVVPEETEELKKIHLADSATQRISSRPGGLTTQNPCPESSLSSNALRVSQLPQALER